MQRLLYIVLGTALIGLSVLYVLGNTEKERVDVAPAPIATTTSGDAPVEVSTSSSIITEEMMVAEITAPKVFETDLVSPEQVENVPEPAPAIPKEIEEAIEGVIEEDIVVGEYCQDQYWPPCEEGHEFYCPETGEPYCHAPEEIYCNGKHWQPCNEGAIFMCTEGEDPVCLISADDALDIPVEEASELTSAELENLMLGTVRIMCENADGSQSGGSGVVLDAAGLVATNAHVIENSETDICEVIFPLKNRNGVYAAAHYLEGEIVNKTETLNTYYEGGVDIAYLQVLPDENNSSFFLNDEMHHIEFPICEETGLNDTILHIGYASNLSSSIYSQGDALSTGEAIVGYFGDVATVTPQAFVSAGQVFAEYEYSWDDSVPHEIVVSVGEDTKTYYGSSGGLAFNKHGRCVQGLMSAFATNEERTILHTYIYNLGYPEFYDHLIGL